MTHIRNLRKQQESRGVYRSKEMNVTVRIILRTILKKLDGIEKVNEKTEK